MSPEEMRDAAKRYPNLTSPVLQEFIEQSIEKYIPEPLRPAYLKRLEWLRAIPQDRRQASLDAFIKAASLEELREAVARFPYIRSKQFRDQLMKAVSDGPLHPPIETRLHWLDALGAHPADTLYEAAQEELAQGHLEAALDKVEQLARLHPERSSHILHGKVLLQMGRAEKAIELLSQAIDSRLSSMAYWQKEQAYIPLNPSEETMEGFHRALLEAYTLRGRGYLQRRQRPEAMGDFNRALQIEPTYREALIGRGVTYVQLENWPAAIEDLSQAHQQKPEDEYVTSALAFAYLDIGEAGRVSSILDSVRSWSPNYREQIASLKRTAASMQEAFEAFTAAQDEEELVAAIREHRLLMDSYIHTSLGRYIHLQRNDQVRMRLLQHYDVLLSIVKDPRQLAVNALMAAKDLVEVQQALKEHPLLRKDSFRSQLEQMAKSIEERHGSQHLSRQLKLLRKAEAEE
jgi:tetratricopeptide (TPR) repeat protein